MSVSVLPTPSMSKRIMQRGVNSRLVTGASKMQTALQNTVHRSVLEGMTKSARDQTLRISYQT